MAGLGWAQGLCIAWSRLRINQIDQGPDGDVVRVAAPLCPCKRPLGKGSSVGTVPQSPQVYNQGTTLAQAVKGRDSISLPGIQLDPVGTWAVPGHVEWDSQEVCWDKGAAWMGATVERDPRDQDGNTLCL